MKIHAKTRLAARFGVALCAAIAAQSAQSQPAPKTPLKVGLSARLESLEVSTSKATYQGGEPVWLDIVLINKSTKPAEFLLLGPKLEFKVKRENKTVVLTYLGKDLSKGDKVSYRSVPVGGQYAYRVVLNRLFDLSRAGNYTLVCTKRLKNENRDPGAELVGPLVVSQTVKFSVSDTDFEPPMPAAK